MAGHLVVNDQKRELWHFVIDYRRGAQCGSFSKHLMACVKDCQLCTGAASLVAFGKVATALCTEHLNAKLFLPH